MKALLSTLHVWLDSWRAEASEDRRIDFFRILPFIGMHVACLAVLWVGVGAFAIAFALALFALRMFAITAFYHRYFSHRSFKTSRAMQFVFGVLGASAAQRGPLWWAAHHRDHHRHSDLDGDAHSPKDGFWNSHMGWFLRQSNLHTRKENVRDLMRFKELVWLDRFDQVVPMLLAVLCFAVGSLLESVMPTLGTSGPQLLVWGFFVSTVALYHASFTINSLAHRVGTRPFHTKDESRNSFLLALLTLGEGWHNNHHRYPAAARQGFKWWEIDVSYYLLRAMATLGLVWQLKAVPQRVLKERP